MSSGISLQAWRTVAARVDSSESPCRSLLTVNPPREKPRSTSHEDARYKSVKKLIEWDNGLTGSRQEVNCHTSERV